MFISARSNPIFNARLAWTVTTILSRRPDITKM